MKRYNDFIKELNSGKLRQCYYISGSGQYLLSKACELLKEKIFKNRSNDGFFVKYADETSIDELREFIFESPSLFTPERLILIRRCEKYSRKLDSFFELSESVSGFNYIVCVFDNEFVKEKKLSKKYEFYDFSEITGNEGVKLVVDEFKAKGISVDETVGGFLLSIYRDPDFLISEIDKVSDYVGEGNELNKEVLNRILKFINTGSSFEELFVNLIKKDRRAAMTAADSILTYQAVSEIYLLAVLSSLFTDLLLFKKSIRSDSNNFWGERARILKECSSEVTEDRLKYSVKAIIEADKMLKNSTVQPKIIIFNLIASLISFNG